jgi:cysteine-rich repeat protein
LEICGDGKKYTSECDDGNNINGDGCSKDCNLEVGFSCYGGSPRTRDTCTSVLPSFISIEDKGQSRLYGKVVLNVRLNFLPRSLITSANDCKDACSSVLNAKVTRVAKAPQSITARYIPTTSFLFSIEIDFGMEPLNQFTVEIGVNQNLKTQYFSGIDTSRKLTLEVSPVFMSMQAPRDVALA